MHTQFFVVGPKLPILMHQGEPLADEDRWFVLYYGYDVAGPGTYEILIPHDHFPARAARMIKEHEARPGAFESNSGISWRLNATLDPLGRVRQP